ncbi:TPA: modulator of post-segregation killing protein, partial [Escherichia coli]
MSSPHQDSLLPRFAQGEEGHETTTKFPCLVCVDRVSHTVDIHLSDTK